MIKGRDIIVVGLQAWDIEIGSNCKNLALEFSKNNRVLYVNSPMDRLSGIRHSDDPRIQKRKNIIKGKLSPFEQINDNLTIFNPRKQIESISQIKPDCLFDWLNKINNKRLSSEIKFAISTLKFSNYYLFNDSDMFRSYHLKELLNPEVYIYYTRDNMVAVDYWKKQGIRIEAKHMQKADIVVANSTYLAKLASEFNPKSYFVGQGCETDDFSIKNTFTIPAEIEKIKKPIIGYIGALKALRLDINILIHIAKKKPEWNLVLVGPEDDTFKNSELHKLSNVFFTGNKTEAELPSYLAAFDVALNPQLLNKVTIGNYPRKIDEYLAMGKATLATKTEAMSYFEEFTYLATTKEDYVTLIEKALNEDSIERQEKRAIFAASHTWENNAKEIYKRIEEFEITAKK